MDMNWEAQRIFDECIDEGCEDWDDAHEHVLLKISDLPGMEDEEEHDDLEDKVYRLFRGAGYA